ncbi:MAG: hypothetical protein FJ207_09065 [Gemmatimonadetes bacterium]|nr:hypothetical protein [Gemmatimonadota bacterium]
MTRLVRALAAGLLLAACGESTPEPPPEPSRNGRDAAAVGGEIPSYERSFVFAGFVGDSILLVPWMMRTSPRADSVVREAHGWLGRRGTWDPFYSEQWTTAATRAPSRILPHGALRLLVQEGDVIDGIVFGDGERRLELALGEVAATWGGPRGETVELVEGVAYLANQRVQGVVAHLARASAGSAVPGGDWGLLLSGDSMKLVLAADIEHGGDAEPRYRGYADLGGEERLSTEVSVSWTTTEAFPPARRDVPVAWRLTTQDGSLRGDLRVVTSHIQAGTGPGPLLPVRALYEVAGEIATPDRTYSVQGLFLHERR